MGLLDTPTEILSGVLDPISDVLKQPFGRDVIHRRPKQVLNTKPDFAGGFCFAEIVDGAEQKGVAGAKPGQVCLNGNFMPQQPFQFGGSQKLAKEYYPGNAEPAVHVLGARENDLTIHGKFKDKRFDNPKTSPIAIEYQKQCDAVRIRGNLLHIWMGEWERYGFLEEVTFKLNTKREIEYELRFFIVGFNKPRNCKLIDNHKLVPFNINTDLISTVSLFNATYSAIPASMPKSLADIINGAISDVAKIISIVTNFVDTVLKTIEDVIASAHRAIGLIKNARAAISKFMRRIGSISFSFTSIASELKSSAQFKSAFSNQAHVLGAMSAASSMEAMLAKMQGQFGNISQTVPLRRYLVRKGDTLQKISLKFYNTADNWQAIYDHNKLTSTSLNPGLILEIPKI